MFVETLLSYQINSYEVTHSQTSQTRTKIKYVKVYLIMCIIFCIRKIFRYLFSKQKYLYRDTPVNVRVVLSSTVYFSDENWVVGILRFYCRQGRFRILYKENFNGETGITLQLRYGTW